MNRIPKGTHKDQRCFVIANGPSLEEMDLSVLKDEIVICTDDTYKALGFDPSYVATGDEETWAKVKEAYAKLSSKVVCSSGLNGKCGSDYRGSNMAARVPLSKFDVLEKGFHYDWGARCYVNRGYDVVTETVLPFVCWSGFAECFLIGCDCEEDLRLLRVYENISIADHTPTQIYNAGIGGQLESFSRRTMAECLTADQ